MASGACQCWRSHTAVPMASTVQVASVAAIAGSVRRRSAPKNAAIAKAASVQAAKATPSRPNASGSSLLTCPSARKGW